jgi:hypothetical protein
MEQVISPIQAIRRGRLVVIPTVFVSMIGGLVAGFYFVYLLQLPEWCYVLALPVMLFSFFFATNYVQTEWWIWALERVRNVQDLRIRAINNQLMLPEEGWIRHLWFKTPGQQARLEALQYKFDQEDERFDDPALPASVEIRYWTNYIVGEMLFFAALLACCVWLIWLEKGYILFSLISGFCLYRMYRCVANLLSGDVPLEIGEAGIRIRGEWHPWSGIEVVREPDYESSKMFVFSKDPNDADAVTSDNIRIDNLQVSNERLAHLLRVYHLRYENSNNS